MENITQINYHDLDINILKKYIKQIDTINGNNTRRWEERLQDSTQHLSAWLHQNTLIAIGGWTATATETRVQTTAYIHQNWRAKGLYKHIKCHQIHCFNQMLQNNTYEEYVTSILETNTKSLKLTNVFHHQHYQYSENTMGSDGRTIIRNYWKKENIENHPNCQQAACTHN